MYNYLCIKTAIWKVVYAHSFKGFAIHLYKQFQPTEQLVLVSICMERTEHGRQLYIDFH